MELAKNIEPALRKTLSSFSYWSNLLYSLVALVYLSVSMRTPMGLLFTAGHDDGLFINNAFSIFSSGWLPEYNQYVLAKGPGLPIFIAISAILGLPITLSLSLIFLASTLALARTLNRVGLPPLFTFAVFSLIIANFTLIPTRLIRDNLYASLTIFATVLALELFLVSRRKKTSALSFFVLGLLVFLITVFKDL